MIEGSITKVEAGTKIANETAEALTKIVDDVAKAATLVADIATASNEQATGIAQINQGIMQVSQVVQTNSATAEESAAASEELSSQAELLKESVGKYTLRTERYSPSNKFDELSPEVRKMLEGMSDKTGLSNDTGSGKRTDSSIAKTKILLNDSDFGKY
jgi:methyl-accepting chemotaxis protein